MPSLKNQPQLNQKTSIPKILGLISFLILSLSNQTLNIPETKADNPTYFKLSTHINPKLDQPKIIVTQKPGKSEIYSIYLQNNSLSIPYKIKLESLEGSISSNGTPAFQNINTTQRFQKWINLTKKSINLKPNSIVEIPFFINIPTKTQPGEYFGAIAATIESEKYTDQFGNPISPPNPNKISSLSRTVKPIFISIPGRKKTSYSIENLSLSLKNNKPEINLKITNTGNTILELEGETTLTSSPIPFTSTKLFPKALLQPSETFTHTLQFEKTPFLGNFSSTTKLTFLITDFKNKTKSIHDTITQTESLTHIPWLDLSFLLITTISISVFIYFFKSHLKIETQNYTTTENDTITEIAKKHKTNWKKIARLNHLKPPYIITPNTIILIPKPKNSTKNNQSDS